LAGCKKAPGAFFAWLYLKTAPGAVLRSSVKKYAKMLDISVKKYAYLYLLTIKKYAKILDIRVEKYAYL